MKGGLRQKSDGFTIIEILIVLGVTGALFTSAITMMSGRQRQADFNTSIRDVQSQLQQTISEVGTGFYPSLNNFSCDGDHLTGPKLSTTGATSQQGSSQSCIFLGKVIQFGVGTAGEAEQFPVFSVVGLRAVDGDEGQEVNDLAQAMPRVIAPAAGMTSSEISHTPDVTAIRKFNGGLSVFSVRINGDVAKPVGAIGFISSLDSVSGDALKSGSQHVNAMPVKNSSLHPASLLAAAKIINDNLDDSQTLSAADPFATGDNVQICINSGSTDQSGLITIGGNGRELSVDLQIQGVKCR